MIIDENLSTAIYGDLRKYIVDWVGRFVLEPQIGVVKYVSLKSATKRNGIKFYQP